MHAKLMHGLARGGVLVEDAAQCCYNHALSDLFRSIPAVYGHSGYVLLSCCVRLVPSTHNLWGFRNEGLLSVPQIKHDLCDYASFLLFLLSFAVLIVFYILLSALDLSPNLV